MNKNKATGLILELSSKTLDRQQNIRDAIINDLIDIYDMYNSTDSIRYAPNGGELIKKFEFEYYEFINTWQIPHEISLPNKDDNRMYIQEITDEAY